MVARSICNAQALLVFLGTEIKVGQSLHFLSENILGERWPFGQSGGKAPIFYDPKTRLKIVSTCLV